MGYIREGAVEANGLQFFLAEAGEASDPAVILLHGFPETWASWRYQLPVLAESGFHVLAPELRGYGESAAPPEVAAYSQRELAADVAALIEASGHEQAVVVGHDWGAALAWQVARLHPERVRAVAGLSVPYGGPAPEPPTETMRRRFGDCFFYMLHFQQPDVPEQELEADIRDSLRRIYHSLSADADPARIFAPRKEGGFLTGMEAPDEQPRWMREVDLDYYVSRFEKSGFRGPLNWYRAMDLYWEQTRDEPEESWVLRQPALYIAGEQDPVYSLNRKAIERMPRYLADLRGQHIIPRCGHWTQMEQDYEVNRLLLGFLEQLDPA